VIAGIDLGVSVPTSRHFDHRVDIGAAAIPYVGYMFSDYIGLQFNPIINFQTPDDKVRVGGQLDANGNYVATPLGGQWTTMIGYLAGPRIEIPFSEWGVPLHLYGVAQGGGFSGISGTVTQTEPGMSFGGGFDFYLTDNFALSLFGRWNRMVGGARPNIIGVPPNVVYASPPDDGPVDFNVAGIGVKLDFRETAAAPPPPPPPPRKAEAPPPAPPTKKRIVLRGVNFDFDKANIRPQDVPILEEAVRTLKAENLPTVVAIGHTDSVGTEEYNQRLSMRRAEAVRRWLTEHGIPRDRIIAEGRGESEPVASNETADGRAQNRRVELKVRE
jgi:OOP family OmpA-OmpF porin